MNFLTFYHYLDDEIKLLLHFLYYKINLSELRCVENFLGQMPLQANAQFSFRVGLTFPIISRENAFITEIPKISSN